MSSTDLTSISERFPPQTEEDRTALLEFARKTPLAYGPWKQFKSLYKRVEATLDEAAVDGAIPDTEILSALISRLDAAPLSIPPDENSAPHLPILYPSRAFSIGDTCAVVVGGEPRASHTLATIDVSDPFKLAQLGSLPMPGVDSIAVCGRYACVLTQLSFSAPCILHIVDLVDLTNPRETGTVTLDGSGIIACRAPYVYISIEGDKSKSSTLQIIDFSDPAHPRLVGSLKDINATALVAAGNYLYAATAKTGFRWGRLPSPGKVNIIDVSDAEQPRLISSLDVEAGKTLAVSGQFLYACIKRQPRSDLLQIVDVSDPARPRKLGHCQIAARWSVEAESIAVQGNYAYVAAGYNGLHVALSDKSLNRGTYRTNRDSVRKVGCLF